MNESERTILVIMQWMTDARDSLVRELNILQHKYEELQKENEVLKAAVKKSGR